MTTGRKHFAKEKLGNKPGLVATTNNHEYESSVNLHLGEAKSPT